MKNIIKLFTIAMLSCLSLTAQNSATKKADNHFARYEFLKAAEAYQKLITNDKADTYVYTKLADCYFNIFNTVDAEKWYAKALETSEKPETIYKYSQMLKANGKYDESNKWMDKFASMRPGDDRAIAYRENPNYLPKILEKGNKFNLQDAGINTATSDFGGTIQGNKLYITSARNNSRKTYKWNDQPYLDIYEFTINEDGSYQGGTLLSNRINTKYHEGLVSFSPDGNTIYFSRESLYDNVYLKDSLKNRIGVINLYSSTKLSDGWSEVTPLPFNSPYYSVKNPSVSADGKTLYFSSDMAGGYGNYDIYKAAINDDGSVGRKAVNLGQKVNTEGQEMFPYSSSNGTLYFSSDGHLGLGGLDVFHTKEIDGKFAPIRNVGVPVNSNADDFAFSLNEETEQGFVSSNREGGLGSDDIYAIKKLQPLCDVLIIATVTDSKNGTTLNGASVGIYDTQGNMLSTKTTDANGIVEFIVECETDTQLQVIMTDFESASVDVEGTSEEEVSVDIAMNPIEKIIIDDEVVLNPIYFEFDKSNITAQAAFELDKLVQVMNKYPELVIRAESHTDHIGSATYNQKLSERRALTTVQYVISKGVDETRITGVGKGENDPKIDCGGNCTKEDRAANRRSEFHIVKDQQE